MNIEHKKMYDDLNLFLRSYADSNHARDVIAPLVAITSLEMNHLYEDLGFKSRTEMGKYMMKHFPKLAEQKPKDKLWKKFLYECIDSVAPACKSCDDQETCFRCILSEASA